MAYSVTPRTNVDEIQDTLYSVRKVLYNEFGNSVKILLERDGGKFERPSIKLDVDSSETADIASSYYASMRTVRIRYLGTSRSDTQQKASQIEALLMRKRYIPHVMRNWKYPTPGLRALDGGNLGAGTYYVRVAGETLLGEYSLASDSYSITISEGQNIKVLIPMVGGGTGYFKNYRIYVGMVAGYEKLLATVPASSEAIVTQYTVSSVPVNNNTPPESSEIYYRFMKMETINTIFMEDLTDIGKWDAVINTDFRFINGRVREQKVPMTKVTHQIELEIEVN